MTPVPGLRSGESYDDNDQRPPKEYREALYAANGAAALPEHVDRGAAEQYPLRNNSCEGS